MEILISIPPCLHPLVEWLVALWLHCQNGWLAAGRAVTVSQEAFRHVLALPYSNIFLPIVGILLVFWPILLSLAMAIASAWAWIFWLITSMLLGFLQVGYASYQFLMISVDIGGLSFLKTYAIVRNQILYFLGDRESDGIRRKSRRRLWNQRLEEAGSYENFLKIRIDPKDYVPSRQAKSKDQMLKDEVDGALPPLNMKRSHSLSNLKVSASVDSSSPTAKDCDDGKPSSSPVSYGIPRNHSFSGELRARQLHEIDHDPVVVEELGRKTTDLLVTTTNRLEESRLLAQKNVQDEGAASSLKYLLAAVVKRNHLNLDDVLIENARNIAESGQYGLSNPSRQLIRKYYAEVEKGLDWIAEAPVPQRSSIAEEELDANYSLFRSGGDLADRITLVRKMKQNMGRTALMLSGGGAQAMYHVGVIRALIESKLYDDIRVISGTSGGSITAAMCAIKTPEELLRDVCVSNVSTDYMLTGEMKEKNIRWFPPMWEMASYWMKHKLLVDSDYFQRTCEHYYGTYTFEEAFLRTGKHVCITVSASRASGHTAQRLLLNHISTPHVTIASAVRASCALPGVMAPAKLIVKNSNGTLEPFEVDGVEWIDGSVQADLPFQRISTLFAVTSFIVSQTNFHVVPFLNKAHHPSEKSLYWRLFQTLEWDIRSRALKLSRLGLFPRFFGQDISKVFKQKYHGNLTIVPRFTTMQTFGLKALSNPTVKDMEGYLKYSQIATWPYLNTIRDIIRLEKSLDDCLARLEARMRIMHPDTDWASNNDDIESIASSSAMPSSSTNRVRIVGRPPLGLVSRGDSERFRQKVNGMERENQELKHENQQLREELEQLRRQVQHAGDEASTDEIESVATETRTPLSEGSVWNLVRNSSL